MAAVLDEEHELRARRRRRRCLPQTRVSRASAVEKAQVALRRCRRSRKCLVAVAAWRAASIAREVDQVAVAGAGAVEAADDVARRPRRRRRPGEVEARRRRAPPISTSAPGPPSSTSSPAPPTSRSSPPQADEPVVAGVAVEAVGGGVAADRVVAGAADGVLDQRARVAWYCSALKTLPRAKPPFGPPPRSASWAVEKVECAPGRQVDREVGRVVRQVVGVDAAAVPDRLEDAVAARRDRQRAVDEGRAGRRVPGVGGVAGVGGEVGAVHVLQRGDVEHHEGLGVAPGLVVAVGASPDVGLR